MKNLYRVLSVFLSVLFVVSISPLGIFAGTFTPTIPVCSEHTGGMANCQSPAICDTCGESYGSVGDHIFSGSGDATCNFCDYTREVSESPFICFNHKYDFPCDSTCSVCGNERVAADHSGGSATCSAYAQCQVCGEAYGALIDHTYDNDSDLNCNVCGFTRIDPNDPESPFVCFVHAYSGCEDTTCNNCGSVREAKSHEGGTATCTNQAVCLECGMSYGALLDHAYDNACDTTCNSCGTIRQVADHFGGIATCTEKAKCTECGASYGQLLDHTYDNLCDSACNSCGDTRTVSDHVYDDDKDASCNECGYEREVAQEPSGTILYGDVNGDGKVNNKDLGFLQRYVNGFDGEIDLVASDINADGKVNNKDLGLIQRYINGWDIELPGGGTTGGETPDEPGDSTQEPENPTPGKPSTGVVGGGVTIL